jgi:hypothetical protein
MKILVHNARLLVPRPGIVLRPSVRANYRPCIAPHSGSGGSGATGSHG